VPSQSEKQGQAAATKAEDRAQERNEAAQQKTAAQKTTDADQPREGETRTAGDASRPTAPVVADAGGAPFSRNVTGEVDPRTGETFDPSGASGRLKGRHGEELLTATGTVVPGVDPERIPAEALPGFTPDAGGDRLLAAAQAKAPSLTREFVDAMQMTDEQLAQIARGEISPPPTPGPRHTNDLYMTPGGWQVTPPGVPPEDVGGNAIAR